MCRSHMITNLVIYTVVGSYFWCTLRVGTLNGSSTVIVGVLLF
jgi:hypothetical protein